MLSSLKPFAIRWKKFKGAFYAEIPINLVDLIKLDGTFVV
jgi:hypothetical protein